MFSSDRTQKVINAILKTVAIKKIDSKGQTMFPLIEHLFIYYVNDSCIIARKENCTQGKLHARQTACKANCTQGKLGLYDNIYTTEERCEVQQIFLSI